MILSQKNVFLHPFSEKPYSNVKLKNSILIFVCSLLLVGCAKNKNSITIIPQAQKNHLQVESLKGQVKSLVEYKYASADQTGEKTDSSQLLSITHKFYSADGYLNRVVIMNNQHDTISVRRIYYDDNAKMIRDELFDSLGVRIQYTLYENDKHGFRVKESRYANDSLIQTLGYKNDGYGNPLEITLVSEAFSQKIKYAYNEVGLPLQVDEYDPDGQIFKYVTMEYDNYGDLVNKRVYRKDGIMLEYTHIQMNEKGEWQKQVYESLLPGLNLTEVTEFSNHDGEGNWLRKVRKIDNKAYFINTRIIEYY